MSVAIVDSNVAIEIFEKAPLALTWYRTQGQLAITPITWLEVMYGASKLGRAKRNSHQKVLDEFAMEYLIRDDFNWAMRQMIKYGLTIDIDEADYLIASVAHRLKIPLYTHNMKHMLPLLGKKLAINPY